VSYENPPINGATPCGETKQVSSTKGTPSRPQAPVGTGPRNPRQGGL
jgi:hypothetical protein